MQEEKFKSYSWTIQEELLVIIFKSRDITLPTKVPIVKATVFPVVMYGCESWTVKKAERQRNDAFELWWWRKLLRVPWTARRSNQSILKEISPGISLEGMILKLNLQYFGHLMWRVDSLEKTLMLGGIGGRRRREGRGWDGWRASPTQWTWVWVNSGSWWWTGRPGVLWFMGSQRVGHDWATDLIWCIIYSTKADLVIFDILNEIICIQNKHRQLYPQCNCRILLKLTLPFRHCAFLKITLVRILNRI